MPTLKEIVKTKQERLSSVPDKFVSSVTKAQNKLLSEVSILLDDLDRTNGLIEITNANFIKTAQISEKLKQSLFEGEYLDAVKNFAKEFPAQAVINNALFEKTFPEFKDSELYYNVLKASQHQAVSLFDEAAINTEFIQPATQILQTSVTTGQSYADAVDALTEFIGGNEETLGGLERYVGQVAKDAFSFSDRQYTNIIANDLDVEWYLYSGGEIKDTRCFCHERHGKYYHKKEIEAWGNREDLGDCRSGDGWQGMAKGTNASTIFVFAGGYNCEHSILPVSVSIVPQDVIERNLSNGNYNSES